jgi:hypothetical protein
MTISPDPLCELRDAKKELLLRLKAAGVSPKLLSSIGRKCLLTPRRQTGRPDRRTNREQRWKLAVDHPDYCSEENAHLVELRLLLDMLNMRNAPDIDRSFVNELSAKYLTSLPVQPTKDPLTNEVLDYTELVADIVDKPKHGYSKFHIGHQEPKLSPKHLPGNVRWQLKASNDFQGSMNIRVARIAFRIDQFTITRDPELLREATRELEELSQAMPPAASATPSPAAKPLSTPTGKQTD